MNQTRSRHSFIYLELIRIIAILFVIYNHTNKRGYTYFTTLLPNTSILYWCSMAISAMCGVAVPLFFMVSGATLLGKDESIRTIWSKRIQRIILVLVCFSFIQYLNKPLNLRIQEFNFHEFCTKLLGEGVIIPYWYLYSYLGFLVGLPFIRAIARQISKREILYLIILSIFFDGIIPILGYLITKNSNIINSNLYTQFISRSLMYPILGYYISINDDLVLCQDLVQIKMRGSAS